MEVRVAKELLHIQHWLELAASIVARGKDTYDADEVAQEAGDSLMIKIGEAAKTLAAREVAAPAGVSWSDAAKNREKLRPAGSRQAHPRRTPIDDEPPRPVPGPARGVPRPADRPGARDERP